VQVLGVCDADVHTTLYYSFVILLQILSSSRTACCNPG